MDEETAELKEERVPNAKIKQSLPKAAKLIDIFSNVELKPRPPVKNKNRISLAAVKENKPSIVTRPKVCSNSIILIYYL